jgi:hypothetical protein
MHILESEFFKALALHKSKPLAVDDGSQQTTAAV